jgi:hypothetical protein
MTLYQTPFLSSAKAYSREFRASNCSCHRARSRSTSRLRDAVHLGHTSDVSWASGAAGAGDRGTFRLEPAAAFGSDFGLLIRPMTKGLSSDSQIRGCPAPRWCQKRMGQQQRGQNIAGSRVEE